MNNNLKYIITISSGSMSHFYFKYSNMNFKIIIISSWVVQLYLNKFMLSQFVIISETQLMEFVNLMLVILHYLLFSSNDWLILIHLLILSTSILINIFNLSSFLTNLIANKCFRFSILDTTKINWSRVFFTYN